MATPAHDLQDPGAAATVEAKRSFDVDKPVPKNLRRVLMLTHRLPYPPDRGDRIRSFHMLQFLSRHFDVAVAATSDDPVWLQHHELLSTIARRVVTWPISSSLSRLKAAGALLTGRAGTPASFFRSGLAQTIRHWHEQEPFDAILTYCSGMIEYARLITGSKGVKRPDAPIHVLDLVDVDSVKWHSYAKDTWPPMRWVYATEARRLRKIEAGRFDDLAAITVVSEHEAQVYRQRVGEHPGLRVIGNGVDMEYFSPQPDADSKTILFVGVLDYKPNTDAVVWFVRHVMPELSARLSGVRFQIVGRHPTKTVFELDRHPGVEVVGSVPDVRTYLAGAAAVVAPLRIARGVQNKVLEAMACARAVVCSPGAAEGIEAIDDQHILIADQPDQWVTRIEEVLTNAPLRQRLAASARRQIEARYNWEARLEPFIDLLGGTKCN